jgi:hypothetical protein
MVNCKLPFTPSNFDVSNLIILKEQYIPSPDTVTISIAIDTLIDLRAYQFTVNFKNMKFLKADEVMFKQRESVFLVKDTDTSLSIANCILGKGSYNEIGTLLNIQFIQYPDFYFNLSDIIILDSNNNDIFIDSLIIK